MQKLTIKDLAVTAELDGKAMASVIGGYAPMPKYCPTGPAYYQPSYSGPSYDYGYGGDVSFNASQTLGQSQNTTVNNGNNVAFSSGITANVAPSQNGSNNINFA